jgi:hypothetical protein
LYGISAGVIAETVRSGFQQPKLLYGRNFCKAGYTEIWAIAQFESLHRFPPSAKSAVQIAIGRCAMVLEAEF